MKVREVMTSPVVRIHPDENAAVAARTLTHYNIGILPVCGSTGHVCGLVTDRDLVTRCMAAGRSPTATTVAQVMTKQVAWVPSEATVREAEAIMQRLQVRRLPVLENGKLRGMVSLGDLAKREAEQAGETLGCIASGLGRREEMPQVKLPKIK